MVSRAAFVWVLPALTALAACGATDTSVLVEVDGVAGSTYASGTLTVTAGGQAVTRALPMHDGKLTIPGTLLVTVADVAEEVRVSVSAAGQVASGSVMSVPHERVRLKLNLVTPTPPAFLSIKQTQASGTSITAAAPTGVQDGDFLLAGVYAFGSGTTVTPVDPSWMPVSTVQGAAFHTYLFRRFAAHDPETYGFTLAPSMMAYVEIAVYAGVNTTAPVNAVTGTSTMGNPYVAPSINTTVANTLLVGCFMNDETPNATWYPPDGFTPRETSTWLFCDEPDVAIGQTPTVMATDSTNNMEEKEAAAFLLALAPAS